MLTRLVSYVALSLFTAAPLLAGAQEPSSQFATQASYGVPGATIPAGSFTIQVKSHLSNRYIVAVKDQSGSEVATFLGVSDNDLSGAQSPESAKWPTAVKGVAYLKGWSFPSDSLALEFVYPKDDAVAIAQANHARVAAIDPKSDGLVLPDAAKQLSDKDLQVVTLWLLTPTHVGAGIAATKYTGGNQQVASVDMPAKPKQLPHTASYLPWFYLGLALSTGTAMTLRVSRARASQARRDA
jgi:hypothetical protein